MILGLASCFYISYLPAALLKNKKWTGAGLMGSLFGAAYYFFLPSQFVLSPMALAGGLALAIVISGLAEKILDSHDDSRIVIDEWIGVWIALYGFQQELNTPFILAVILFRFFDVWKGPWGHRLQKLPGGFGVTLDDVAAGLLANVCTRLTLNFL